MIRPTRSHGRSRVSFFNAGFKMAVRDGVTFSLQLLNILNTTYFTVQDSIRRASPSIPAYPMPPFSIETGVQVHL